MRWGGTTQFPSRGLLGQFCVRRDGLGDDWDSSRGDRDAVGRTGEVKGISPVSFTPKRIPHEAIDANKTNGKWLVQMVHACHLHDGGNQQMVIENSDGNS
jgi:hypothetical protein